MSNVVKFEATEDKLVEKDCVKTFTKDDVSKIC